MVEVNEIEEVISTPKDLSKMKFLSQMNLDAFSQSLDQKDQICSSMMISNENKGHLSRRVMDSDDEDIEKETSQKPCLTIF